MHGGRMLEHTEETFRSAIRGAVALGIAVALVHAESNSTLTGRVIDPSDRAVPGAEILVRNSATLAERSVTTNSEGIYEIPSLPAGIYRMHVSAPGFRL